MGKALPVGLAVLSSGVSFDAPKHIFLMLFLLTDMKQPDTFFRPYYDLLPTTLRNMPIFWREEELQLLQGSYLVTQARCCVAARGIRYVVLYPADFVDLSISKVDTPSQARTNLWMCNG